MRPCVYREYRLDKSESHFEVDHLISLELGGADVAENLWPQSYDTEPWNAHTMDKLEDRLHAFTCAVPCGSSKHDARLPRIGSRLTGSTSAPRCPEREVRHAWREADSPNDALPVTT